MKMCCSLLTLLASVLVFSVAEAFLDKKTLQLVNGICKNTADMKYCSEVLCNNLETNAPSNKDLMNVTVIEADKFTENTYFFISTLLRNAGDERDKLQQCASSYALVTFAFENALSSFNQAKYGEILKLDQEVSGSIGICKTDFNVPGFKINPLIDRNRKTRTLVDMVKIACVKNVSKI